MQSVVYVSSIDLEKEIFSGCWAQFARFRSILGVAIIDTGLVAFFFNRFPWYFTIGVIVVGVVVIAMMWLWRSLLMRRARSENELHNLMHKTRDDAGVILSCEDKDYVYELQQFTSNAAERIARLFRKYLSDGSIHCVIRLADQSEGQDVYLTRGRSAGMDPTRAENSRAIPADKGLAHALLSKSMQGVFIISDLEAAANSGVWLHTPNDRLTDVVTVMVGPINSWVDSRKTMTGMLAITSNKNRAFKPIQTTNLKSISDFLGLVYPIVFSRINTVNWDRESGEEEQ